MLSKSVQKAGVFAPEVGAIGGSVDENPAEHLMPGGPIEPTNEHGAIVQIIPHLESGPISRFAADLALTVQRLGGDSRMFSSGGRFAQEVARAHVVHETMKIDASGPLGLGGSAGQIGKMLSKWNTRLVHSHGAAATVQAQRAIGKKPIHHIASLYRLPDNDAGTDSGSKAILAASRVIVASEFLKKLLVGSNPQASEKVSVIPPGMAINAVHPSVVTAARLTRLVRKVDIATDAPIILFPAAVQPNSGHDILLDVLENLNETPWACIFATIGPGNRKTRNQLQSRIEKSGLQNRVRFVENCDDPATLYKLSSVVVSSVVGNLAFDYAAAEAQAAGKVVLVPNSGSSQYQIRAGENGAIFETGDAETLGMAIHWALTLPPDTKAGIEHAATATAYKAYKKDEAVKRIFSVYDTLLA